LTAKDAARFLRGFGDATRLRILGLLTVRGLSVSELVGILERPQPNITRHLRYLEARGLVQGEAVGNSVVYRLAPPANPLQRDAVSLVHRHLDDIDESRGDRARLKQETRGRRAK